MDLLSSMMVKARKEHSCDYCQRTITKGEQYEYANCADEGYVWAWKTCRDCLEVIDLYNITGDGDPLSHEMFVDIIVDLCKEHGMPTDDDTSVMVKALLARKMDS